MDNPGAGGMTYNSFPAAPVDAGTQQQQQPPNHGQAMQPDPSAANNFGLNDSNSAAFLQQLMGLAGAATGAGGTMSQSNNTNPLQQQLAALLQQQPNLAGLTAPGFLPTQQPQPQQPLAPPQQQQQQDGAAASNNTRMINQAQQMLQLQLTQQLLAAGGAASGNIGGGLQPLQSQLSQGASSLNLASLGGNGGGLGWPNANSLGNSSFGLPPTGLNPWGGAAMTPVADLDLGIPLPSSMESYPRGKKEAPFPLKLHQILSNPEFNEYICWNHHGRSFRILKPPMFEQVVLPLFFRHGKYASFMRQVNGWGFKRVVSGDDHNSYFHELFQRDDRQACLKMIRFQKGGDTLINGKPKKKRSKRVEETTKSLNEVDGSADNGMDADNSITDEAADVSKEARGDKQTKPKKPKKKKLSIVYDDPPLPPTRNTSQDSNQQYLQAFIQQHGLQTVGGAAAGLTTPVNTNGLPGFVDPQQSLLNQMNMLQGLLGAGNAVPGFQGLAGQLQSNSQQLLPGFQGLTDPSALFQSQGSQGFNLPQLQQAQGGLPHMATAVTGNNALNVYNTLPPQLPAASSTIESQPNQQYTSVPTMQQLAGMGIDPAVIQKLQETLHQAQQEEGVPLALQPLALQPNQMPGNGLQQGQQLPLQPSFDLLRSLQSQIPAQQVVAGSQQLSEQGLPTLPLPADSAVVQQPSDHAVGDEGTVDNGSNSMGVRV